MSSRKLVEGLIHEVGFSLDPASNQQTAHEELESILNSLEPGSPQYDAATELNVYNLWLGDSQGGSDLYDIVESAIQLGAAHGDKLVSVNIGDDWIFWFAGTPESVLAQVKSLVGLAEAPASSEEQATTSGSQPGGA